MKTVYSEDHRLHTGAKEIFDDELVSAFEKPQRMDFILSRIRLAQLGDIVAPQVFEDTHLLSVHTREYIDFLIGIWENWTKTGFNEPYARPIAFPVSGLRQDVSNCAHGLFGRFAFDISAPIVEGSWTAIRASAAVALSGLEFVSGREKVVFSLCRPPGHHAMADKCGGYCYLNNAAIVATAYREAGANRVSILDVDYHHGNGTQSIFYDNGDVQFLSIHGDPNVEYPFYLGYADECGVGSGEGCNFNYPLPWGTDWSTYESALGSALAEIERYGPDVLVVSLGVDTYSGDPISKFRLEHQHFLNMGRAIAGLQLPTHFVMEGGYAVEEIGVNVVNVLSAFEEHFASA